MWFIVNRLFSDINVSQGSVPTCARCAGIFSNHFAANFLRNQVVKEFWKSVKIWQRYHHEYDVSVFKYHGVDMERNVVCCIPCVGHAGRSHRYSTSTGQVDCTWSRTCASCPSVTTLSTGASTSTGPVLSTGHWVLGRRRTVPGALLPAPLSPGSLSRWLHIQALFLFYTVRTEPLSTQYKKQNRCNEVLEPIVFRLPAIFVLDLCYRRFKQLSCILILMLMNDSRISRDFNRFYRAMLCIRGTSHGPVSVCPSVSVCHKSEFY